MAFFRLVDSEKKNHISETGREKIPPNNSSQSSHEFISEESRGKENSLNWGKVGRNAPCPCGSGKKFKHCHGAL